MNVVAALARRMIHACVESAEVGADQSLPLAEEPFAAGMTSLRRAQFVAGRQCARAALARLGCGSDTIVADADGAPIWPGGFVGSITHKRLVAVAAVASRAFYSRVGIDLECDDPHGENAVADWVLTHNERLELRSLSQAGLGIEAPATLVMSAKEAVFKACSPSIRTRLDWGDIELAFQPVLRSFVACIRGIADRGLVGSFEVADGWILTAALEFVGAP